MPTHDYKVLYANTIEELQIQVNTHLNQGYSPIGGVCVDGSGQTNLYYLYQAVNKTTLGS